MVSPQKTVGLSKKILTQLSLYVKISKIYIIDKRDFKVNKIKTHSVA